MDEESPWYPRGERIEEQCFDTILEPVGKVSFTSCWPGDSVKEHGDAVFLIEKNGVIWQQLEGMTENNIRENLVLIQVEAVSFADSNQDGYDDIFLILSYVNEQKEECCEVRYYSGSDTGSFALERALSEELTEELTEPTIAAAKAYLKEKFGFEDEPEASTVVEGVTDSEWQLKLIAENVELWRYEEDYLSCGYAVTDLDQNGRLEILASSMQGTGLYTYTICFEVNEAGDGMDQVVLDSEVLMFLGSEPDIMQKTATVYCDSAEAVYRYLFDDTMRISAASCVNTQMILWKEGSQLLVDPLAYEDISAGEDFETHTYQTMDGEELTKSAYNSLADEKYSGLSKRTARFGWLYLGREEFDSYDFSELCSKLEESWEDFDIY